MAFPGTDLEIATVFQMFGLPQNVNAFRGYAVATIFGSFGEPFDLTVMIANLNACLAAVTASQYTLLGQQFTDWSGIATNGGLGNPIRITTSAAGSKGVIVDYQEQKELIRQEVATIIGFDLPHGGFTKEIRGHGRVSR